MLLQIHDLPTDDPLMTGVSFHATDDLIDRIWWDGESLQVVTRDADWNPLDVWTLDFTTHQWAITETFRAPEERRKVYVIVDERPLRRADDHAPYPPVEGAPEEGSDG